MIAAYITVLFYTNIMTVELAVTREEKNRGMMYRESWGKIGAMLFVFDRPGEACFWMKDTPLKMGMWFLDSEGRILERHDPEPLSTDLVTSRATNVAYVLEIDPRQTNTVLKHYEQFRKSLMKRAPRVKP